MTFKNLLIYHKLIIFRKKKNLVLIGTLLIVVIDYRLLLLIVICLLLVCYTTLLKDLLVCYFYQRYRMGGNVSKEEKVVLLIDNNNDNKNNNTTKDDNVKKNIDINQQQNNNDITSNDNNNNNIDINIFDDFVNLRSYLVNKVPVAVGIGGIMGTSAGYLIGNGIFLYGYTYSFGLGFVCTSYYSGVYAIEKIRKKDDIYNHGLSGSINGALLGTGLYGIRKGLGLGFIGLGAGLAYKFAGDNIYRIARDAWISSRVHTLSTSRPRRLEVHKPLFPPKQGEKVTIIPQSK